MERNNLHYPDPDRHLTDDELIAVYLHESLQATISHALARVIASQHHGGQGSALYSFVSTGYCDQRTFNEVVSEIKHTRDKLEKIALICLLGYIDDRMKQGQNESPVENWHKLWLEQPGDES